MNLKRFLQDNGFWIACGAIALAMGVAVFVLETRKDPPLQGELTYPAIEPRSEADLYASLPKDGSVKLATGSLPTSPKPNASLGYSLLPVVKGSVLTGTGGSKPSASPAGSDLSKEKLKDAVGAKPPADKAGADPAQVLGGMGGGGAGSAGTVSTFIGGPPGAAGRDPGSEGGLLGRFLGQSGEGVQGGQALGVAAHGLLSSAKTLFGFGPSRLRSNPQGRAAAPTGPAVRTPAMTQLSSPPTSASSAESATGSSPLGLAEPASDGTGGAGITSGLDTPTGRGGAGTPGPGGGSAHGGSPTGRSLRLTPDQCLDQGGVYNGNNRGNPCDMLPKKRKECEQKGAAYYFDEQFKECWPRCKADEKFAEGVCISQSALEREACDLKGAAYEWRPGLGCVSKCKGDEKYAYDAQGTGACVSQSAIDIETCRLKGEAYEWRLGLGCVSKCRGDEKYVDGSCVLLSVLEREACGRRGPAYEWRPGLGCVSKTQSSICSDPNRPKFVIPTSDPFQPYRRVAQCPTGFRPGGLSDWPCRGDMTCERDDGTGNPSNCIVEGTVSPNPDSARFCAVYTCKNRQDRCEIPIGSQLHCSASENDEFDCPVGNSSPLSLSGALSATLPGSQESCIAGPDHDPSQPYTCAIRWNLSGSPMGVVAKIFVTDQYPRTAATQWRLFACVGTGQGLQNADWIKVGTTFTFAAKAASDCDATHVDGTSDPLLEFTGAKQPPYCTLADYDITPDSSFDSGCGYTGSPQCGPGNRIYSVPPNSAPKSGADCTPPTQPLLSCEPDDACRADPDDP